MSTPIELYELTLNNFKSFGNASTIINLHGNFVTLIVGRNYDASVNGQIDSNGSGKTTILDAISYCLYGKTISDIKVDGLINNVNKKNLEVSMVIKRDGVFYRIIRFRKNKERGGNGIAIYKGNTLEEVAYDVLTKENDIAEAGTADAQIEKLIGIPFEIFSRIVIFSATHEPFLNLPASSTTNKANQRDIIEELLGITEISEKAEKLKKSLAEDNKEVTTLIKVEEELNKQKDKLRIQLDTMAQRIEIWDTEKESSISLLKKNITELSNINYNEQDKLLTELDDVVSDIRKMREKYNLCKPTIVSLKDKINKSESWVINHTNELSRLESQISSFDPIDFDAQLVLIEQHDAHNSTLVALKTLKSDENIKLNNASKAHSKACDEREHLQENKCPYCKQQFVDVKEKLKELETIINENYIIIAKTNKNLAKIVDSIYDETSAIDKIDASLKFTRLDALHKEKSKREAISVEYFNKQNTENPYASDDIDKLKIELISIEKKSNQLVTVLNQLGENESEIKDKLLFKDKVALEKSKNRIDQLKSDLEKSENSTNPHLATYEDMKTITVDGSNAAKIDELNYTIIHKTLVHKLLTKPDSFIRKSLLIDRLKYLNERLRYYLDVLGLPHKVEFTEELEARITQFGNELAYGNLSAGQKARVNIALSFAFRDVLQKRYGKINFCILDECLDIGLSNVGVTQAVQMIKQVAAENKLSMFVISHRDEIVSSFSSVMEIELKNGFSEVVK